MNSLNCCNQPECKSLSIRIRLEKADLPQYIYFLIKDLSANEITLLEFRDLVFVEMFGDKRLVNNCASEFYDDLGSGKNVQYCLNQQEFRLEKLRAKFCNKSKVTNEKSSFAETAPRLNDNEVKDIESSYLGDYEHEDLTERFEKMEI